MDIDQFIDEAIKEDIREGDHTSLACIPATKFCKAEIVAKQNGVIAGIALAERIFKQIDPDLELESTVDDGDEIEDEDLIVLIEGNARSILKGERLVLNFMQRMSGIATLTRQYVKAVEKYPVTILDTRKTTPLFRAYQKMAVKIGGGENHRFGLYDMILIKDNHIAFSGGIEEAILSVNHYLGKNNLDLKVEIEAASLFDVKEIISIGKVGRIMLDNFPVADVEKAVKMIGGKFETEVSGNINLDTIEDYAACGVNYISVGALTHSAGSLDLSLKALHPHP